MLLEARRKPDQKYILAEQLRFIMKLGGFLYCPELRGEFHNQGWKSVGKTTRVPASFWNNTTIFEDINTAWRLVAFSGYVDNVVNRRKKPGPWRETILN